MLIETIRFLNVDVVITANSVYSLQIYEKLIVNTIEFEKICTKLLYITYFNTYCLKNVVIKFNDYRLMLCVIFNEIALH